MRGSVMVQANQRARRLHIRSSCGHGMWTTTDARRACAPYARLMLEQRNRGPILLCAGTDPAAAARLAQTAAGLLTDRPAFVVATWRPPPIAGLQSVLDALYDSNEDVRAAGCHAASQTARAACDVLEAHGIHVTSQVLAEEQSAWQDILELADRVDAGVIVAGTSERSTSDHPGRLGRQARALAHRAHRPMLLVPADAALADAGAPALFAYDGSVAAGHAVAAAASLLRRRPAVVASVWHSAAHVAGMALVALPDEVAHKGAAGLDEAARVQAAGQADEAAALLTAAGWSCEAVPIETSRNVSAGIVDAADAHDAVVVVTGTRGRSRAAAALLGSTAEGVLRARRPARPARPTGRGVAPLRGPACAAHEAHELGGRIDARRVVVGQRRTGSGPAVVGARQAQELDAQARVAAAVDDARHASAGARRARARVAPVALRAPRRVARHRAGPVGLLAVVRDDGVGAAVDRVERRARVRRARVQRAEAGRDRDDGGKARRQLARHPRREAGAVGDARDRDAILVDTARRGHAVQQPGDVLDVLRALLAVQRPEAPAARRRIEDREARARRRARDAELVVAVPHSPGHDDDEQRRGARARACRPADEAAVERHEPRRRAARRRLRGGRGPPRGGGRPVIAAARAEQRRQHCDDEHAATHGHAAQASARAATAGADRLRSAPAR